ncbi:MAG: transporter substrate-binding domain-containing protein [Desulfovibrio sp.]|uniref:substrate-binding periplasmic protein n=1 Tax=Desulfovibrio sp. TaxID=885 RepID=UPI0025B87E9A|nr:transporter substrate-binding domain-containing protein [Desulfovibrio sp.]MBS6828703.1 transporter substrate-binding domain-containing protein [Desulfovibrio sp.]
MRSFLCRRLAVLFLVCVCVLTAFFLRQRLMPSEPEKNVPPVLRVGMEDHYPPMAFMDAQGRHTGFDHDMAEALCRRINAKCEFVIGSFDDILRMMTAGELDILVAGLAALEPRKQYMDFTEPYYRSSTIYIGRPGLAISEEGLRGKRLAAQIGSMQLDILKKNWSNTATVVEVPFEALFGSLVSGEVDAVLVDAIASYDFLKSEAGRDFGMLGDPLQINDVLSLARIGVRKGERKLTEALNKALMTMRVNGEYNHITRTYFPFNIY